MTPTAGVATGTLAGRRLLRCTRWDCFVAAYSLAYLVVHALTQVGPGWLRSADIVMYFGLAVATILAQIQIARSGLFDRRTRQAWGMLAASATMIFVSGAAWTAWKLLHGSPSLPDPGWSRWLTDASLPLATAGYLLFPRAAQVTLRDRRALLDALLLATAGMTVSWYFSGRAMYVSSIRPGVDDYVSNIGDLVVFTTAAFAYLRSRSRVMRTAIALSMAAIVWGVLADFFWSQAETLYRPGDAVDALWFASWIVRWASARYAWHATQRMQVTGADDVEVSYRSGIAPTAFVAAAYLLLAVIVLEKGPDAMLIAVAASLMTALLIVRQRAELTENQRLARATLAEGERFLALLTNASDRIAVVDGAYRVAWTSPSCTDLVRIGEAFSDVIHPDDRERTMRWLGGATPQGDALPLTCRVRGKDGAWSQLELRIADRRDDPRVRGFVVNGRDVSGERALEQRLRRTATLVTLHDIAGRIAHTFNNLLAVIAGHAELLSVQLQDLPAAREDIASIRAATDRGAGITRQLLGFSGRHVIQPVHLPVAATIEALVPALGRSLPRGTTIDLSLADRHAHVLFDRAQFEQVLVNLVANARDAMPAGGVIGVSLDVEPPSSPTTDDAAAALVVVRIRDGGVGIEEQDLRHIFEPFFTTKAPGLGTGLGLAMVDTIVRRAGGHVTVESAPGAGTTVAVHLPLARGTSPESTVVAPEAAEPRGRGVVLLVDDETGVRRLSRRMLERAGFSVIEAASGGEAIAVAADAARQIDILVTDMMMPVVSGREVIARFTAMRPGTPIIVVTGFAAESKGSAPLPAAVRAIVAKPFSAASFLRAVSGALATDDGGR
ncbi:MAG: response regulator [Gemmatimonadetes bacterium]|nr:response regulator [Gemmatimonadota bacterium]